MDVRVTFVLSECAANSSCKHANLSWDAIPAFQTFHVCRKIESYNEDSTSQESLSALLRATSALPDVFQVSDVLFIVCGFPAPTIHSVIAT